MFSPLIRKIGLYAFAALVMAMQATPAVAQYRSTASRVADLEDRLEQLLDAHERVLPTMIALEDRLQQLETRITALEQPSRNKQDRSALAALEQKVAQLERNRVEMLSQIHQLRIANQSLSRSAERHSTSFGPSSNLAGYGGSNIDQPPAALDSLARSQSAVTMYYLIRYEPLVSPYTGQVYAYQAVVEITCYPSPATSGPTTPKASLAGRSR
jgi:TolA-binding protein